MAPLEVIGAGFGRTGTDSLREALNILGYRTHHMKELIARSDLSATDFVNAYNRPEDPVDWNKVYKDYTAATDWPTVSFIDRLIDFYPNAKVSLTLRDPDSWYASVKNTIYHVHQTKLGVGFALNSPEHHKRIRELICSNAFLDGAFRDDTFLDENLMKQKYMNHIEWVKTHVPPERLLLMDLDEGWERLCRFLGKEVPNVPYPRSNSTKEFQDRITDRLKTTTKIAI